MISNVKGEFKNFLAEIDNEDFKNGLVKVDIETSSISTNSTDRDNHLKSADFFDVENHPAMTFESTRFTKVDDNEYKLKGLLTVKGISKEVVLDVEFGGINKDPVGK